MKILGEYQNNIHDLPELDIQRYERIFKIYQTENDNKKFNFYNILKKIELPKKINHNLLLQYKVQTKTPLTTISYQLYDDIESWWIIYLLNKNKIPDLFWVNGGTILNYLTTEGVGLIFNAITRQIEYDGRHF